MPVAVRSSFDRWAASYELSDLQRLLFDPVHVTVQAEVRRHVVDRAAVLDVGCGTGRLLRRLGPQFAVCVGIDPAPGMVDAARELGTKTKVETVNRALAEVAARSARLAALERIRTSDDDVSDRQVMDAAWR